MSEIALGAEAHGAKVTLEPGSFRDRTARVFYHDGKIFRGLNETALKEWQALSATKLLSPIVGQPARSSPTEQRDLASPSLRHIRPMGWRARARKAVRSCPTRTNGHSRCSETRRCCSSTWDRPGSTKGLV